MNADLTDQADRRSLLILVRVEQAFRPAVKIAEKNWL